MQPCDTDVDHELRPPSEILGGEKCFARYRQVRRARGHHHHQAAGSDWRLGRPGEEPGLRLVARVRQLRQYGGRLAGIRAREQGDGISPMPYLSSDSAELSRGLALAINGLRIATAGGSFTVESGKGGQVERLRVTHS